MLPYVIMLQTSHHEVHVFLEFCGPSFFLEVKVNLMLHVRCTLHVQVTILGDYFDQSLVAVCLGVQQLLLLQRLLVIVTGLDYIVATSDEKVGFVRIHALFREVLTLKVE